LQVEVLVDIAVENARTAASNLNVLKQEYRIVNGKKVIYMEMTGIIRGLNVTYLRYYFSSPSGSTQFLAYTATSKVDAYRDSMIKLLNGLDVQ